MKLNKIIFALIALMAAFSFTLAGNMRTEEIAAIGLFVYFLLNFIDSIGKSYNLMDIPILLALFQCMLMPAIVFHIFNEDAMVIALKYDMGVTAEVYYGYMFPAIIALIIGLKLPEILQASYGLKFTRAVYESRQYLKGKGNLGILMIIIGFAAGFLQVFIPGDLQYVAYLFGKLLYVGVLYTYFSDSKNRTWYIIGGIIAVVANSLAQAMFGELVYLLALSVILILLGRKISNTLKYSIAIVGFIFVIVLQSIKSDYRDVAWRGQGGEQGNTEAFFTLFIDRLASPEQFFDMRLMFPTVNRFNQGMIVGKVMVHVPRVAPFADGETIFSSLAASFVPRLLWPNKPVSGGHFNMERFTGFKIEGYSMNISPMGEAYGNFGVTGGIFFMFFYGLFFSGMIFLLLKIIRKRPTLILWFPILFLNSIQIETDILMCVNSLLKNLIFIGFCYWAADRFLRLKL